MSSTGNYSRNVTREILILLHYLTIFLLVIDIHENRHHAVCHLSIQQRFTLI